MRKPFQGVTNIIKFNRHFFILAGFIIAGLLVMNSFVPVEYRSFVHLIAGLILAGTVISLAVSYYVYDLSDLYKLNWLRDNVLKKSGKIVNINAGFDETSSLINSKFRNSEIQVFDFYDPANHTEVSIERAQKHGEDFPGKIHIKTSAIPLENNSADLVFLFLAAHEIRNDDERIIFFKEILRILKDDGYVMVVDHLRNLSNFLAYNFGFFHFLTERTWNKTFFASGFNTDEKRNITPFIKLFILKKNGAAA